MAAIVRFDIAEVSLQQGGGMGVACYGTGASALKA